MNDLYNLNTVTLLCYTTLCLRHNTSASRHLKFQSRCCCVVIEELVIQRCSVGALPCCLSPWQALSLSRLHLLAHLVTFRSSKHIYHYECYQAMPVLNLCLVLHKRQIHATIYMSGSEGVNNQVTTWAAVYLVPARTPVVGRFYFRHS